MVESLENILKKGFQTWRNNLSLSLPFLLSSVVSLIVIGVFILLLAISVVGSLFSLSSFSLSSPSLQNFSFGIIFVLLLLLAVFIVIMGLIDAFFESGAIGMAKEATLKGKTSLKDMVKYGKKKFISLFFADLLVGLIVILGLVILGAIFIGIPFLLGVFSGYGGMNLVALLFIVLGVGTILLYLLVMAVIFAPVKYSVVVSDLGTIAGVKRGYTFFKEHKLQKKYPIIGINPGTLAHSKRWRADNYINLINRLYTEISESDNIDPFLYERLVHLYIIQRD